MKKQKKANAKTSMKINWKVLIASLAIVYLVAFIGSLFTSGNINTSWYQEIKPSIIPLNFIFPVVWNILFFLIALSLYFAYINSKGELRKKVIVIFSINLILNILWSVLFFSLKQPAIAFIELLVLWLSIIAMIFITKKADKKASLLLVPYLLWISFAGVLNWLAAFG